MARDKYTAVWVSHSSIRDYLQCPRAYYLRNVYKDPKTNRKMSIVAPALALGQAVHTVLESLSVLPTAERFELALTQRLEDAWGGVSGEKGGFANKEQERAYKQRATEMLARVQEHPGPLARKAVKIQKELPYYWISEELNIILCGKIDWLEFLEESNAVHIVDFKTGKTEEDADSFQLPIYYLLAQNNQERPVEKMSYWYLDKDVEPVQVELPDAQEAEARILEVAKRIKTARKLEQFACREGEDGCYACRDLEKVLRGEAKFVGVGEYNQDLYMVTRDVSGQEAEEANKSIVL